jgi:hypothetical protein
VCPAQRQRTADAIASPAGAGPTLSEGTFSICTFWYVDALARSGRLEAARLVFEKMFTYANHLGLYAEEIGLTGEQLGDFPQAFTHLSLINAAVNLDYQLDHGAGLDPVRRTSVQRIGAATWRAHPTAVGCARARLAGTRQPDRQAVQDWSGGVGNRGVVRRSGSRTQRCRRGGWW